MTRSNAFMFIRNDLLIFDICKIKLVKHAFLRALNILCSSFPHFQSTFFCVNRVNDKVFLKNS